MMVKLRKVINILTQTSFKTLYFNLKYLPFSQAIRFPILVARNVRLRKTKGKVVINGKTSTGMIKIGYKGVEIFDYKQSRTIWKVGGLVIFKGSAHIGHGTKISVEEGVLILGDGFIVTAESSIIADVKTVEFGNNCLLSWDVLIMDTDFHIISDNNGIINQPKNIQIGDHVWIGCRTLILKGSNIPNNSIIAAGSLVNKQLEGENKVFGGQPARELQSGVVWKR